MTVRWGREVYASLGGRLTGRPREGFGEWRSVGAHDKEREKPGKRRPGPGAGASPEASGSGEAALLLGRAVAGCGARESGMDRAGCSAPGPSVSRPRHPFRRRSEPVAAAEDSDSIATHALFDSRMFLETVSGRNLRWNIQLIMVAAKLRGKLLPFVLYYAQSIVPTQRFHFILRVNLL